MFSPLGGTDHTGCLPALPLNTNATAQLQMFRQRDILGGIAHREPHQAVHIKVSRCIAWYLLQIGATAWAVARGDRRDSGAVPGVILQAQTCEQLHIKAP